jgi:type VI secretion system protein ImpM
MEAGMPQKITNGTGEPGYYGKLHCRGDFLQRRVPQSFVDVWDEWLQECVHVSHEQLQDAWLEHYLTGPMWRFVLDAGVCDDSAYAGVLVPSVDRVGRYFPLTVVTALDAGHCAIDVACTGTRWFETAEGVVLEALAAEEVDIEAFDERIARLGRPLGAAAADEAASLAGTMRDSVFPAQPAHWHVPLNSVQSLQRAVNALAHREISRTLHPAALWWTEGSKALDASWLITRGLPAPHAFTAMLSGQWAASSWISVGAVASDPLVALSPDE